MKKELLKQRRPFVPKRARTGDWVPLTVSLSPAAVAELNKRVAQSRRRTSRSEQVEKAILGVE